MVKTKQFLRQNMQLSIFDISLAGLFVSVWIIVNRFLTLNFGIMEAGITYAVAIIVGLYFKPLIAVVISIIADTISLVVSSTGIGFWMWQYAIIYPILVLCVGFMKWIFTTKEEKYWIFFSIVSFLITLIGAFLVAILKDDFVHASSQGNKFFDFAHSWSKALIWCMLIIMFISYLTMMIMYFKKPTENLKMVIMVYSIVSIIIVVFIWIWGPYADIKFVQKFYRSKNSFSELYNPALIVRILKTPVILPLYTIIVYPLYKLSDKIDKHNKTNKWK